MSAGSAYDYMIWGIKGIGGVLGMVERAVRESGPPAGEARETLAMYARRMELCLLGDPVPVEVRSLDDWRDYVAQLSRDTPPPPDAE